MRNVAERLPKGDKMLANQVRSLMRAAWRLPQAEEGIVRIKKLAGMIECDHPAAAASLREGLEETFTNSRFNPNAAEGGLLANLSTKVQVTKRDSIRGLMEAD